MKTKRSLIKYIFLVVFLIVILYMLSKNNFSDLRLLFRPSFIELFLSIMFSISIFAVSGIIIYYILKNNNNTYLKVLDIFTLPIVSNLWSYLIPIKGGMLYTSFFLKKKYGILFARGMSISVYTYLLNIVFIGIIGIIFSLCSKVIFTKWLFLYLILALSPLFLFLMNFLMQKLPNPQNNTLKKIIDFIKTIIGNSVSLFKDWRNTCWISVLTVVLLILTIVFFYQSSKAMVLNLSIHSIIILVIILHLSIVMRFAPGNLGINELLSGGAFAIININPNLGILISLYVRLITLLVSLTIGSIFTMINLKYLEINKLGGLLSVLRKENKILP